MNGSNVTIKDCIIATSSGGNGGAGGTGVPESPAGPVGRKGLMAEVGSRMMPYAVDGEGTKEGEALAATEEARAAPVKASVARKDETGRRLRPA
jgi:hypothetical protein